MHTSTSYAAPQLRRILLAALASLALMLPMLLVPAPAQAATTVATRVSGFAAGPATVTKGKAVTYSGQVQRASGKSWVKTGAVSVHVYFDPDGTAPRKYVRTIKTNATGYFKSSTVSTVSGKWSVTVPARGSYKASTSAAKYVKVVPAKIATRVSSFAAGPATVTKGKAVTYSGQAQRASGATWAKTGAVTVNVYFDPDGAAPKKLVRSLKTGSTGYFKASTTSSVSGKWSAHMPAQGNYLGSYSATKYVKVVAAPKPTVTKPINLNTCPSWAPIKGNASSMIYHMPGQSFYTRTNPEACFATESAAVKAGYRKAKV